MRRLAASLLLLAALRAPARAQERPFTMPDLSGAERLGLRGTVGAAHFEPGYDSGADEHTMMVSSLLLEGEASLGPLAVTGVLPVAMVAGGLDDEPDGVAVGNPTLDAVARVPLEVADHTFLVGAGAGGSLGLAGSETSTAAAALYYQELGRFWSYGHTLRAHGDAAWRHGRLFAQVQLGVDWHLADGEYSQYRQALLRLGLAAGVHAFEDVAILAELTTLSNVLDVSPTDEAESDHVAQTLELGARWNREVSAGASLFVPLERDIGQDYTAAVGVGVEVAWTPGLSGTR